MKTNKDFTEELASNLVDANKQSKENFLTGEKNLVLTKAELEKKLLEFKNGKSYLGVLKLEQRILEGQGVIKGELVAGNIVFSISDWDSFISRVNAFHVACGPY